MVLRCEQLSASDEERLDFKLRHYRFLGSHSEAETRRQLTYPLQCKACLFSAAPLQCDGCSDGHDVFWAVRHAIQAGAECLKAGPQSKSPIGGLNIIDPPKDELALD
jgi:hypothetical protein